MAKARFLCALFGVVTATACARPLQLAASDNGGAQSTQVVIVAQAGKPATSTPVGAGTRIPPTPTFDPGFGSVLTPLAMTPTELSIPPGQSPTPELRPTRTPAPSVTPFPTIEIPPTPERTIFLNPPTRTAQPSTATRPAVATRQPTITPTASPVDPNGSIGDLASAKPIAVGANQTGLMNGPTARNVFSFDVANADDQIVVTLTGQDIERYRLFLISPGRQQSAYGQVLGASGRVIRYPARGEVGIWYVEVTTDGKKVPAGNYTLRVDVRTAFPTPAAGTIAATPSPTSTRRR